MPERELFRSVPFWQALDALHDLVTIETAIRDDDGVIVDFRIDYMNRVDIDVANRDRTALIGRRVLDVYPAMAGSDLFRTYVEVVEQHRTVVIDQVPYEDTIDGKDVIGYYSVNVAPFGTDGIIISARDISEALRTQAELRAANERLDAAQRLAGIGLWEADLSTGTVTFSDELLRVFGLSSDEPLASFAAALSTVIGEGDRPHLQQVAGRALEQATPFALELNVRLRDGTPRILMLFGTPNTDVAPARLWGTAQDITDQRAAQKALHEAEEQLAREQQLAALLLDAMRPEVVAHSNVDVAARYVPAGEATRVGGDWFDTIELDDDTVLVVIGDIAGHGVTAAALMAQIRNAIRGCAFAGLDPGAVLETVGRMLRRTDAESLATCIVAVFAPSDGRLTWANAGHPPPVIVAPGSGARFLTSRPGPPLPFPGATYRVQTDVVAPSSTLVFYTDGLIERRDRPLDAGLDDLSRLVETSAGVSSADLADILLTKLAPDDSHSDDICVLVVRASD